MWMKENLQPHIYPNIEGNSYKSMAVLTAYWGPGLEGMLKVYIYVPGLKDNDPKDLVLFFVNESGRRRWHGDHVTVFGEKRWIVIPPCFSDEIELNEWISTSELKDRIRNTLDFLKTNNRPNWQNTISEQIKFLELIHD